jgi:hypothetical protein
MRGIYFTVCYYWYNIVFNKLYSEILKPRNANNIKYWFLAIFRQLSKFGNAVYFK